MVENNIGVPSAVVQIVVILDILFISSTHGTHAAATVKVSHNVWGQPRPEEAMTACPLRPEPELPRKMADQLYIVCQV